MDDIEYKMTHDPAVPQRLSRKATRVAISERDLLELPLQRYLTSDVFQVTRWPAGINTGRVNRKGSDHGFVTCPSSSS